MCNSRAPLNVGYPMFKNEEYLIVQYPLIFNNLT